MTALVLVTFNMIFTAGSVQAADYTWDTATGDSAITDGAGTWQVGVGNWYDGTSYDQVWVDGNEAIFGTGTAGTGGTVTLAGNISALRLELNQANATPEYTINLGGNTLTLTASTEPIQMNTTGALPPSTYTAYINNGTLALNNGVNTAIRGVNNGSVLEINAKITGTGDFTYVGAGDVRLINLNNDFTGILRKQNSGTMQVRNIANSGVASAAGAGDTVQINDNGTISFTASGSAGTTDRTLRVAGGGTARLNNESTSAALVFTGTFENTSTADKTFTLGGASTFDNEIQGIMADNGANVLSVTKVDAGKWILSGNNTYTGDTRIEAGTLEFRHDNALGTGLVNLVQDGGGTQVLQFGADALDLSENVQISNQAGTKTIRLDLTGTTTGTLSGQLDIRRTAAGEFVIDVGDSDTLTVTGDVTDTNAGGAGLTKEGAGTLSIKHSSDYQGDTVINAGTLQINNTVGSQGWGAGAIYINNGSTLEFTGTQQTIMTASDTITLDNGGGGSILFTKNTIWRNSTIVTTGGARNTVSGTVFNMQNTRSVVFDTAVGTDVDGIDLEVSTAAQRGSITKNGDGTVLLTSSGNSLRNDGTAVNSVTINGGTLELGTSGGNSGQIDTFGVANGDWTGAVNLNNAGIFKHSSDQTQTLSGTIAGTGSIEKIDGAALTLSGTSTYNGTTTIGDGTTASSVIRAGSSNGLSPNSAFTINSDGTLILDGNSNTIGSLAGAGNVRNDSAGSAATLTTGGDNSSTTFSGIMTDGAGALALSLVKQGTGTMTMTANQQYTGTTTVSGGTLVVDASHTAGSGHTVNNGTLVLGSSGTIETPTLALANANAVVRLDAGGTGTDQRIQIENDDISVGLTFVSGATLDFNGGSLALRDSANDGNPWDLESLLAIENSTFMAFGGSDLTRLVFEPRTFESQSYTFIFAIPEPSTIYLMVCGATLLYYGYRRFRARHRTTPRLNGPWVSLDAVCPSQPHPPQNRAGQTVWTGTYTST